MQFRPLLFDRRCSLRGRLMLAGLVLELILASNAVLLILENRPIPGLLLFLVALAGTLMSVHTDRRLRANVARLIEATSRLLQGVAEERTEIDTGDQLEVLGNHFNAMAQAIRRREDDNRKMQAQLNEQAVHLESQVTARTSEVAEERRKLNAIVTAIPAGLVLLNRSQTILWANRVAEEWCGPAASMIGKRCHQMLWRASHACRDCPTKRALRTGQVEVSEKLTLNESGEKKYFQIVSSPIKNPDGSISGVVELVQDITESRQLQSQLAQAGKMAAIGQLAAGVAHEINNPIGIILGKAELALSNYASVLPPKVVSDLQMIGRQSHRIAAITGSLLQMSRRGGDERTEVNLNELVEESLPLVEHQFLASKIRLKLALRRSLPCIHGNPGQLQEVLLNLLDNALHAMPEQGGEVELATSHLSPLENGGDNGSVVLVVRDTGTGIPEAIRDRIFDPFFTTKAVGKGTGLGLAILHGIVKSHAGAIAVESETGKGTTFQIVFPCANGSSLRNRPPAVPEENRSGLPGGRDHDEAKVAVF